MDTLDIFDKYTADWFTESVGTPTAVQREAWPAIAEGRNTLVTAPTGTGKTLSAFLVFIDRLKAEARRGTLKQELQLIYISPLKALVTDIRENLRRPLDGITALETGAGIFENGKVPELTAAVRTGDTPQKDRHKMIKTPPHILITTPESLYLMLTAKTGKMILSTARWLIIDELHALIDSKRGAHMMLSLSRLDRLCPMPLQRIGLSATIQPVERAAEYLSPGPVTIVQPKMHKDVEIMVASPFSNKRTAYTETVWQTIAGTVYEHCRKAHSVIAFVEGRMYAEKLAHYINLVAGDGFARSHHGSLSKEQRFEVENALRAGTLRLLCATSSMELGIDVGEIDQVLQVGCPRSISSTLQRLGRAGHRPDRTSVMYIFPRSASEGLYCGLTAQVAREGGVEASKPPMLCLDILSQHLVSMAAGGGYTVDEVMEILAGAYPFRDVTREDVKDVLCMLAGDYEHEKNIPVRPRILYDRIHECVEGDTYSRMLAVMTGGTIPDKGLYTVKTDTGVKLGELDEEFVFESRVGDTFLLGTFVWQISSMEKNTVTVHQSNGYTGRLPFWKGEIKGRRLQTGRRFGALFRKLDQAQKGGFLIDELCGLGMDGSAAQGAAEFVKRQIEATGGLPDDHTIIVEHFRDESGIDQMMVHSIFGRQVNSPLAVLAAEAAKQKIRVNISYVDDDDGFLLFPYDKCPMPEGLLQQIKPGTAGSVLEALLPSTPLFNMAFRYNSSRALMMGMRKAGRQPLWLQRLRSAQMLDSLVRKENHPLIRETKRECLEDYWDLQGLEYILHGIQAGVIQVRELFLENPSPMSLPLRQQTEASMMYEYSPTTPGVQAAVQDALTEAEMIEPEPAQLARVAARTRLPEDEKQLHTLLMVEGDLTAGELDVPVEWLELLAGRGQAEYIEPGLWIAAEQGELYEKALCEGDREAMRHIVLRLLRYRGAQQPDQTAERYFWTEETASGILTELCRQKDAVESGGLYYHAEMYSRARRETVKSRRSRIKTLPSGSYAALQGSRVRFPAPSAEQLERALGQLCGQCYPPELLEDILLPARVGGYRPELLDTLLAQGNFFWKIVPGTGLSFHRYEEIDWEADTAAEGLDLKGSRKIVFEALRKRGASFSGRLSGLLGGESPYDTLLDLAGEGMVCADSFAPVRWLQSREKGKLSTVRQRVSVRAKALTTGRWETAHPLKELSVEEQLVRMFDRVGLLCRETVQGLPWGTALETLRVWEYTGRVRRGYFIEGLSGVQFIRDKDYAGTMAALENPDNSIIWLPAADPAQVWGKCLAHLPDRSFLNIPGTAVALCGGIPAAVLERKGKILRLFDGASPAELLRVFVQDYNRRFIFPSLNRLTVKEYPPEAAAALVSAGFMKEMQDYVLYRT